LARLGGGFYNHGDALAAADTSAGDAVARAAAAEFEQESKDEPCAAGCERMAERNGAAIYVGLVPIEAQTFFDREILRGECFVHFDQTKMADFQAGTGKTF